ncbi:FAD-binding oxidoreductase [Streptomonospora wellingtoniae]|uniref:FAD-binding oxidoreductase n=1 Tax=Streptomonospora wellingtoniae TaxID=3075544 RepID=A0ABU2KYV0_9ACTN|nr:FAD-binding oxidoreductase [Streptomonospora sp. DSM 45055]MDT0304243.1 FAD-binding oxidoreductase [Streptomonospora sp. DSM 45055]
MTRLNSTSVAHSEVDLLREEFAGEVVEAADPSYEESRAVFNAMIEARPAVIALCQTVEDVARAVAFARDHGLEVSIRGGGHSVAGMGTTEGGLVVDLRRMTAVHVDPEAMTARVAGGATMSHLDRATERFGLATTGGRVSTTGVGGFVLGGGTGWIDRKFGLACDNLLAADVVTADGALVHASAEENPELFWALHGGGGNFGVVTSLTLRLHPLPSITAALMLWSRDAGPDVVRAFRDFAEQAPDEVGGGVLYLTGPPEEFVPEHLVGSLTCAALVTYAGDERDGREAVRPMQELGHEGGMTAQLPYAELQCMLDDPPGLRNYWSAEYLGEVPDEAVDLFCARADQMIMPSSSQHVLFPQGGQVSRPDTDYPLPWRKAPWCVHPFGLWDDPADDERGRQWARDVRADMLPWSIGAVYLNFIGNEGAERIVAGLGEDNYRRLAAVKRQYDPDNVFHRNHNIKPA